MKRMILVLLAGTAASPAIAQHSGHVQPTPTRTVAPTPAPTATCTPEHAAMGHCTMPPPSPAPTATCTPEHAAMGHCTLRAATPAPAPTPAPPPTQTGTCTAEHAAMGHCTLTAPPTTTPPTPTPAPSSTCTPEHAAMGHCQMPPSGSAQPVAPTPAPQATCTPEHAAMGHCTLPAQPTLPPAGADPHAGHAMPAQSGGAAACAPEHAAMGHCTPPTALEIPVAPLPPEALAGPAHAQDLFFNPAEAARSRAELAQGHGGMLTQKFLIDQLEVTVGDGREGYAWDAQFWYGGDIDKFWLKTEGEGEFGEELDGAEVQALWSHAIDPWFDLQAGIRQDLNAGPDRTHLVLGVQGLAPYWFEVDGAVFLSTEGEITARFEGEYDLRLTQALILQPRAEVNFSLQNVPELRLGSGLTTTEIGARLRYEFYPEGGPAVIAPYVGVEWEQAFGQTADYLEADGEDSGGVRFVAGVRLWF